ncbi:MAG: BamA/TamA family outer membrane protein [Bacteroidales bacterium]|nr:BamA/TamA family outer membrane protein [Bacteroidales bacterium]
MRTRLVHIILILGATLFASCYTYRYVPDGEHVLYKNKLDVTMVDSTEVSPEVKDALKNARNYYLQKPNSKVLGIDRLRMGMTIYGIANPKDHTFIGNYFRRLGQAPRIYDVDRANQTANQLQRLLQAKGCFGSTVSFDTLKMTRHNITVGYHVKATRRYMIDDVGYHTDNDAVRRLLIEWRPAAMIHAGDPYDQELIAAERSRLVANLREAGYYRANNDMITFEVDTNYSPGLLSIDVHVDGRNLQVYHINNIYIYPNSTAGLGNNNRNGTAFDTLIYNYPTPWRTADFQFVYSSPMTLSPRTISRTMMLFPGMVYRPRFVTSTYNSLLNLRNFKYINIDFSESPSSNDTLPLVDAHVRLISSTQQKISLSLELTNASPLGSSDSNANFILGGNLGIETALEYQHKNLFGGAELLKVKLSGLFELPKNIFRGEGDGFYDHFSAFEAGIDASLDMPILLLPFTSHLAWQRVKPHTLLSAGGSYQYRYYFERILANTSFGYSWSHSLRASHQLLPIELTFVRMLNLDNDFRQRLNSTSDLRLKYKYSSHFIMDARYDYLYTNQQYGTRHNFHSLHLSVESAGNALALAGNLLSAPTDSNGIVEILGVPFSQYVRLGGEWTHYTYLGSRSTFVTRLLIGAGLPYGNSMSMPYEKSFFGGGPTTMRAWQLRRLGPGSYSANGDLLERVGDLQLVLNLEGRFPIVSILEGALFTDIGNVWLLNPSDQYTGGEIKWNSLPSELAVGIGLGLRVNVSIATLRVDFAVPLYDPGYSPDQRWRPRQWHINQVVTNFGINYPF